MLNQVRKDVLKKAGDEEDILEAKDHGPIWIALDVWNKLVDIWNSPKWKDKSEAARKNRVTEKDGGSPNIWVVQSHFLYIKKE